MVLTTLRPWPRVCAAIGQPRARETARRAGTSRVFHSSRRARDAPKPSEVTEAGIPYSQLTIGVPRETFPNERRVAMTPSNAALLLKKGFGRVLIEHDSGASAQFADEQFTSAGATVGSRDEVFASADVLLKVRPPTFGAEAEHIKKGATLVSFLYPTQNKETVEVLAKRGVNALAMDMVWWEQRLRDKSHARILQSYLVHQF